MIRLLSWFIALATFVALLYVYEGIPLFFNLPSVLVSWIFPLLILLTLFSPSRIYLACRHLATPAEAGLRASDLRTDAEVFHAYGILSLSAGIIGSIMGLIDILGDLADVSTIGPRVSLTLMTIFYSLIVFFFVAFPGSRILSTKAQEVALLEETRAEETLSSPSEAESRDSAPLPETGSSAQ